MRREDQVCSFDQAKILDAKISQVVGCYASLFKYYMVRKRGFDDYRLAINLQDAFSIEELLEIQVGENDVHVFPAYTVSELGVLLGKYTVMRYCDDKNWRLYDEKGILSSWLMITDNEAQARAYALISLIESGEIDPSNLSLG